MDLHTNKVRGYRFNDILAEHFLRSTSCSARKQIDGKHVDLVIAVAIRDTNDTPHRNKLWRAHQLLHLFNQRLAYVVSVQMCCFLFIYAKICAISLNLHIFKL